MRRAAEMKLTGERKDAYVYAKIEKQQKGKKK
jgi:hypothetical protein